MQPDGNLMAIIPTSATCWQPCLRLSEPSLPTDLGLEYDLACELSCDWKSANAVGRSINYAASGKLIWSCIFFISVYVGQYCSNTDFPSIWAVENVIYWPGLFLLHWRCQIVERARLKVSTAEAQCRNEGDKQMIHNLIKEQFDPNKSSFQAGCEVLDKIIFDLRMKHSDVIPVKQQGKTLFFRLLLMLFLMVFILVVPPLIAAQYCHPTSRVPEAIILVTLALAYGTVLGLRIFNICAPSRYAQCFEHSLLPATGVIGFMKSMLALDAGFKSRKTPPNQPTSKKKLFTVMIVVLYRLALVISFLVYVIYPAEVRSD